MSTTPNHLFQHKEVKKKIRLKMKRGGSKRKHDKMEEEDAEALKKYLIQCKNEYEEKTSWG